VFVAAFIVLDIPKLETLNKRHYLILKMTAIYHLILKQAFPFLYKAYTQITLDIFLPDGMERQAIPVSQTNPYFDSRKNERGI